MNKYDVALKSAINKINDLNKQLEEKESISDIAIIGYDCRFPGGANNSDMFWKLLLQGYDAVTESTRFDLTDFYDKEKGKSGKTYTKEGAFLEQDIREFDNVHFEISEKEAISMDPQHRLLLEVSWGALENSGLDIAALSGSNTGVFLAMDGLEYAQAEYLTDDTANITPYSLMGMSQHSAAGRIAYYYNFKGPAMMCNTACSSSLVAVNSAVESLKRKQCNMAVVGGVNLMLSPSAFVALSQIQALSPDGRSKAFDSAADGYGRGEGCGVIVLKRLEDAKADGDKIEAVIKGCCVGQDGKTNGFYAPNGLAQQRVMKNALKEAKLNADDIDYIETHGTGTIVGDYIESQSICEVYKNRTKKLRIGSVKTNIGHLEAASGMAGLIKLLLCFKYKKIPPSIHFHNPNPRVDWTKLQFIDKTVDWEHKKTLRCAAISSFGITGTLVHIVLAENKETDSAFTKDKMPVHSLTVSAKLEDSLKEYLKVVEAKVVEAETEHDLNDVLYSLNTTRGFGRFRFAVSGKTKEEFQEKIHKAIEKESYYINNSGKAKKERIGFLFLEESSFETMELFHELYQYSNVFRFVFEDTCNKFSDEVNKEVRKLLLKSAVLKDVNQEQKRAAVFCGEYALAKLLINLGIEPVTTVGFGVGKNVELVITKQKKLEDVISHLNVVSEKHEENANHMMNVTWFVFGMLQMAQLRNEEGLGFQTYENGFEQLVELIRTLYLRGENIKWSTLYKGYQNKRILMPNYAFQKKVLWKELVYLHKSHQDCVENKGEGECMLETVGKKETGYYEELCNIIAELTGISENKIEYDIDLISYGFDSLMLMQFSEKLKNNYHVEIPIDSFFSTLNTIKSIGDYLEKEVRQVVSEEAAATVMEEPMIKEDLESVMLLQDTPIRASISSGDADMITQLFNKQFEVMQQQNNIIKQLMQGTSTAFVQSDKKEEKRQAGKPEGKDGKKDFYVPYHAIDTENHAGLTDSQYNYIKKIETLFNEKTITSKKQTQHYRSVYANARNVAGFTKLTKEMNYQIIVKEAKGAKLVDLDDNEYVDVSMGFGVNLLGHAPDSIQEALRAEIDRGFPLGPMEELPGKVAKSITELTNTERVYFCNSGTEADMVAMRISRAITNKNKIVCFAGAYHGSCDGVLGVPGHDEYGNYKTVPMVPGVSENMIKDLIVLNYATDESLQYIEEHADEIAGVLVESVQSRRPDIQPKEYLQQLRKITKKSEIALIFDEVITGFRIGAGGAQEYFGVEADICTYGKIVGGGMPIGIVAGKAKFMDGVDGGMWQFGDDSVPQCNERRTLATGTFCHHGLAMSAANIILEFIKNNKDWMYDQLNNRTVGLVERLNTLFVEEEVPFRVVNFGSLFRFINVMYYKQDVFFYSMVAKGIYIWEGRNCFLSLAHTDEDVQKIYDAAKQTVLEMKEAGFFGNKPDLDPTQKKDKKSNRGKDDFYLEHKDETASLHMSLIQKRLYSDIQYTGNDQYDVVSSYYVLGELDLERLEVAVNKIVERHEILRTALVMENGEFIQKVHPIKRTAIRKLTIEDELDDNIVISNCLQKFDLAKAPLVETIFAELPKEKRLLIFHFHHTVADGASMETFVKEIGTFYAGGILPPLKKQYKHYVDWENKYLESEHYQGDKQFWSQKAIGSYGELRLPKDFNIPFKKTYECGTVTGLLDQDIVDKLKQYSKTENTSMFMILLAAVNLLLHKLTYQNEIVVKTPVTNRFESGFQDNIGMFTNTVLLGNTIDTHISVNQFIVNVKNDCLKAYRHMNYPYNDAISGMYKNNSQSYHVTFIYEKTDAREVNQAGITLEHIEYQPFAIEDDLKLEFMERNGVVDVYFRYAKEYFQEESMKKYLYYFKEIIKVIIEQAEQLIENIALLSVEEKQLVCTEFNQTDLVRESNQEMLVYQMFEKQVEETPEEIALVMKEQKLSFLEMNEKVNVLAHKLRDMGVQQQDRVVVIGDRTVEFILGILAVMKAGGAYVPVDPTHPQTRIEYIVKDSNAKVVLLAGREVKHQADVPVVDLLKEGVWKGNTQNPEVVNTLEDLVYCIYTSGTTGEPKGVMIKHKSLVNYMLYFKELCCTRKCTVPLFTSCCFDLAGTAIYLSVFCGNTLEIFDSEDSLDIARFITDEKYDCLKMTPSHIKIAVEKTGEQKASVNKHIVVGGEKLEREVVEKLYQRFGEVQLYNEYGPTEATIAVTSYLCSMKKEEQEIPIGKPIPNTHIYILNVNQPCGIGIPGEICITGTCLSAGYLNRPELTAEKFVDSPFEDGKMYRTGDLGRWLSDGTIAYIGREDFQVKIRGFRIELSAIEGVVRKLEQVEDCVVAKKITNMCEELLVAYVVAKKQVRLSEVQDKARKYLPEYMIPDYVLEIEEIPLTANGKVDYKALPDVKVERVREYVAPTDALEQELMDIFQYVLKTKEAGIQDNFFEWGGNSLNATIFVNLIEEKIGCQVTLRNVFAFPTVALLAEQIRKQGTQMYEPIPIAAEKQYYEMSSAQKRLYMLWRMNPESTAYNMPGVIKINGNVDIARLKKAFHQLLVRHEIVRTRFSMVQDKPVQIVEEQSIEDFEYIENTKLSEQELYEEFEKPFDLEKGPLTRMRLYKRTEGYLLLFDMHHIIGDGMSHYLLISELSELYNQGQLEPLTCQYKDYSEWMNQRDLTPQKNYWLDIFSDHIPVMDFPYDYPLTKQPVGKADVVTAHIEGFLSKKINEVAREKGMTGYMLSLSSFMILLSRYSRQDEIIVGTAVSGRVHSDTTKMLGMFVNTLALIGNPEPTKKVDTFLAEMKEICMGAYENQEYPFEELVQVLGIQRENSINPLFNIMFVFQNNDTTEVSLNGAYTKNISYYNQNAKFDITFTLFQEKEDFKVEVEYRTDRMKKESIELLVKHYVSILQQMLEKPKCTLEQLDEVDKTEKLSIIKTFNQTDVDYPKDKTLDQVFDEQVELFPDKIAVYQNDRSITYKELHKRANLLACKLQKAGVCAGDYVVILAEKSIEAVIGILAIIKTGSAYVPIDFSMPRERMNFIIEDCNPKAILTYHVEIQATGKNIIKLEDDAIWTEKYTEPKREHTARNLAYIIYTSGTTGNPKGSMIEHRSILRLVKNGGFAKLNEQVVILETGQLAFDASTLEIWGSLLNGGQLVVISTEAMLDSKKIEKAIKDYGVNFMWMTSTLFNQMVITNVHMFDTVNCLMIGGEQLSEKHVKMFKEIKNGVRLVNGYGPTESTTFTTTYEIPDDFTQILVGKPISNTKVYIMDGGRLCGIGMPGELCITGDGVARGYWNNEALTQEKFVSNPFGEGIMYRTGDLARWMPDGNIEFLGRIDEQVKIRGFRIELEDIKATLESLEEIKECAITIHYDKTEEKSIVAYVVSEQTLNLNDVKAKVSQKLPKYMIPAYFVQIDKIPITRNGKLDKRSLPEIVMTSNKEYVAPETTYEKMLCTIYEEILEIKQVGAMDNFFELGGHSLKATRLINQIEEKTRIRLPLSTVFENQTVYDLARVIEKQTNHNTTAFKKAEKKEFYPMSSAQKRLFFMWQLDPDGILYNMPGCLRLKGKVDLVRVQEALNQLVERHELLRTEFLVVDGLPVQKINKNVNIQVEYREDQKTGEEELKKNFIRPFHLENSPLLRMMLVKRKTEYLLFMDMHHIIGDGMSMTIFQDEFVQIYNGEQLEPLSLQYKDYSEWMNQRDLLMQEEYWLKEFADEVPVLELITDFKRGQQKGVKRDMVPGKIYKELKKNMKKMSETYHVTSYMIYLSVAMILLAKYSNQEDIVVGSPISGRTHAETEKMLGMFVNILAMRGKPKREKTYVQFLNEIKESCLKAFENQEYPFEELVQHVVQERELSRNPLFDVMLVLQNNEKSKKTVAQLEIKEEYFEEQEAKYDCTFTILEKGEEDILQLEYCSELFQRETIEEMKNHFILILEQITTQPNRKIAQISTATEEEKKVILTEYNTPIDHAYKDKTIVELFEEQVKKNPDKVAVVCKEVKLTYREVNEKADMLGSYLRKKGVKENDVIAIMVEKGINNIISILGVLKSGGAYVPIEVDCPDERLAFILDDCNPKMLLVDNLEKELDKKVPLLDLTEETIWIEKAEKLERMNQPNDLAYIIYTSGTTGKPKGVMIEHSGVGNLRDYFVNMQGINAEDKVLQFASPAFDAMISELCMSILAGASLYIVTKDIIQDYKAFENYIFENQITIGILPPQYLSQLERICFRTIITAGSETNWDLVKQFGSDRVYSNDYGPTEVTVCATFYKMNEVRQSAERVPIGKPIQNKQVFIVQDGELCGHRVPGELCVGGIGIARGYLNQPDLTKEKFIKNPFGEGILYRTGDKARWLANGNIEFLGRIDTQVKVRGYRIELGEVESSIRKIEDIVDCAVIVHTDNTGDRELYAYYVAKKEKAQSQVRDELMKMLPDYMIPVYMMQIDKIPLTNNGKLDVRALLKLEHNKESSYVPPQNELEEKICLCFQKVLSKDKVGRFDNFFYIGGHSLRATVLANALEELTGCKLMLKDIFKNPTPEKLTNLIESCEKKEYTSIPVAEKKEYYEMSYAQKRMFLISQMSEKKTAYNMPGCIRMTGSVDPEKMEQALNKIVARHEILRTGFELIGAATVQRIYATAKPEFVYEENQQVSEQEAFHDFVRPFILSEVPLIRMKLIKRKDDYLLFYDMHHLVGDGVSMVNFVNELTEFYNGNELPKMERQYKDYSEWLQQKDLSKQEAYWLGQFQDDLPILSLPLDYKRPLKQSYDGEKITIEIGEQLAGKIQTFVNQNGVTVYMLFLSVAMVLLSKYSQQEDIIIGSPISGRIQKETEEMLGMFVNTLAMRGKPEGEKEFIQFLEEIKEVCMNAYENQAYPFEQLVDKLGLNRDLARNPLFDVMLTVQNNESIQVNLKNVVSEPLLEDSSVAKFDLTFMVEEIEERFKIALEYCSKLFCADTAKRMLDHYIFILEQVIKNPTILLAKIETATEVERHCILNKFNDTDAEYPMDKTITELFAEQVKKHPEKTCVVYDKEKLSYQELDNKAEQLAVRLRKNGVQKNDFVAILTQKSIEVVIGLLAIIKAGAAYVPIDATCPADRICYMLEDAKPKVILVNDDTVETEIPAIDLADSSIWEEKIEPWDVGSIPDDSVYVIYTSGTTGKPKGVIINQTNIITLVKGADYTELSDDMVVMQTGELSFDASTFEIWGTLLNGGTVHLVPKMLLLDYQEFKNYLITENITTLFITTALFNQLLNSDETIFDSLKYLMFGGEKTSEEHVQLLQKRGTVPDFRNVYGPTETTTFAMHYRIGTEIREKTPIGKPVSNTKIYIMNQDKLCGIGICGELCIAGTGVAKGYLNRPELTEEKFVRNPFGEGNMYRSGDLARWLPDGNIEFVGRIDNQVKIRGFRIELEEIESVLRNHEQVQDCVIAIRETKKGTKVLCAYLVSEQKIDVTELKKWARGYLPDYMVPSYYMQIDQIKVTSNGKTDFRVLEQIELVEPVDVIEEIEARNSYEQTIANIWKEILETENVYIYDNFFEIGGNSLLVIRMQKMIQEQYGDCISIGEIFANPTIYALSEQIELTKKGSMHCEAICLKEEYFDGADEEYSGKKSTRKIDGELYESIKKFAQEEEEELHAVVLLTYWHLLASISEEENFYICEGRKTQYSSFLTKVVNRDDYNECKEILKTQYETATKYETTKVQLTNKVRGIMPVLLYDYEGEEFYREFSDFIINLVFEEKELVIESEIINRRINTGIATYILNELVNSLEELLSK